MLDILKGERPQITDDTPEFYAKLLKRCWDHNPENRPTAGEVHYWISVYCRFQITAEGKEILGSAEDKRKEIIKSDKFLSDTKDYKHHPETFYTSRILNESIEQAGSLLNISLTEIQMNNNYSGNKNDLSDKKNYKCHPESNCSSIGLSQQV